MESCYQPDGESEGPGDGLPQAGKDIQHETGSASFAGEGQGGAVSLGDGSSLRL